MLGTGASPALRTADLPVVKDGRTDGHPGAAGGRPLVCRLRERTVSSLPQVEPRRRDLSVSVTVCFRRRSAPPSKPAVAGRAAAEAGVAPPPLRARARG